ncbi:MAG: sugar phosphate nucleotidyltransferase [Thaumarchaeota archaeon]|nr:sugar phosphate nucleotidyltransferase [Nitrososphaerota archaeon]MCL5318584.1 sugar phosphate nucleotidyltransferase [Nitrososphaerota archaeon]
MIRKVVIPAAGMGTRLLSITKEIPKEMLPLYVTNSSGEVCLKPVVQIVFEQLFNVGLREFCFIVGRGKRTIEDHFSPDYRYLNQLKVSGRVQAAEELEKFYNKIESSTIVWINQLGAKGFGHAVLQARSFTNEEPFIVHAGDTYIASKEEEHVRQVLRNHDDAVATLCLLPVKDTRHYGIAEIEGTKMPYRVKSVVEKPDNPPTNLAIMPVYLFTEEIYEAINRTRPGKAGEIQLTDGIQNVIERQKRVVAYKLRNVLHLDIGTPESYWNAQRLSYKYFVNLKGII